MTDQNTAPLDPFRGDDTALIDAINALVSLPDDAVSHRIPGTAKTLLASAAVRLEKQAREAERMRGALDRAKELLSYAAQDTVPEAVAQGNRNAAWHAIDQALAPATGGGE